MDHNRKVIIKLYFGKASAFRASTIYLLLPEHYLQQAENSTSYLGAYTLRLTIIVPNTFH